MDFKDRIEKIKSILPLKFFYEKSFDTNNRTKILSDLKLDGIAFDSQKSIAHQALLKVRTLEFLVAGQA